MSLYVSNILVLAHQPHLLCLFLLLLRSLLDDCDHLGLHLIDDLLLGLQTISCCLNAVVNEIELLPGQVAVLALCLLPGFLVLGPLPLGLYLLFLGLCILFLLENVLALGLLGL